MKHPKSTQTEEGKPTVIDLFAGGGGFSLGFGSAGFELKLAVKIDTWACDMSRFNNPDTQVVMGDITQISDDEIHSLCPKRPDVIVGGPPCQGFSIAGPAKKDPSDPRNSLFTYFAKWVDCLKPEAFVMENVKGSLSRRNAEEINAATVFPVVSGYHTEGIRIEDLTIEGNKDENISLNGCRGGGIFLYRCPGAAIERCTVRNYHGDGISFQQCNDVTVLSCISENNAGLGLHPGSGSQRPIVRKCIARNNGEDGLFLCWRVKQGLFEENILQGNGRFGISIGHKDTDNLLRNNQVLGNHEDGIFFRNESEGMAGNRNRLESNLIENNGVKQEAAGIRVRGETHDLIFINNIIRDTRPEADRKQTVGIRLDEKVGAVTIEGNKVEAAKLLADDRKVH